MQGLRKIQGLAKRRDSENPGTQKTQGLKKIQGLKILGTQKPGSWKQGSRFSRNFFSEG